MMFLPFFIGFFYFIIRITAWPNRKWFWRSVLGGICTDLCVAMLTGPLLRSFGIVYEWDYQYEPGKKFLISFGFSLFSAIVAYVLFGPSRPDKDPENTAAMEDEAENQEAANAAPADTDRP